MFLHKCSKNKYQSIHQNYFFGTNFVCEKHPLHIFCFFSLFVCLYFLKLFHLPIFGELRKLHAKKSCFRWKLAEKSISKVNYFMIAFTPMLQLCHSAMIAIQIEWRKRLQRWFLSWGTFVTTSEHFVRKDWNSRGSTSFIPVCLWSGPPLERARMAMTGIW